MIRCPIHARERIPCPVCFEVRCWIATLPRWEPNEAKARAGRAAQAVLRAHRPETRTIVRKKVAA